MSKAAQQFLELQGVEILKGDVWGHRKDIDEYYTVAEKVKTRLSSLLADGKSIDETVKRVQRETKLSEDLIRYILREEVMA